MRWNQLFDDLEGQLAGEQARELHAEVADRTRRERASVTLTDRLAAAAGRPVTLWLQGAGTRAGVLADLGQDWVMLTRSDGEADGPAGGGTVVPMAAVRRIDQLGRWADGRPGVSMRRFGLGYALRALSRDRCTVRLTDRDGNVLVGTIDRVGADHLDVAEHAPDQPRRREHVRGLRVVPFGAVACVSGS